MKNNYLAQAWLVLTLALLFGAALAGMETAVADIIKANKLNETKERIASLVPGAAEDPNKHEAIDVEGRIVYRAMDVDGSQVGWVVPADGQGFADKIEVLIGLDTKAQTITGLYVLSQKETPGLGNKITFKRNKPGDKPLYLDNFPGKDAAKPLDVVKRPAKPDTNEVEAVAGATISSESVTDIVNSALSELRVKLAATVK